MVGIGPSGLLGGGGGGGGHFSGEWLVARKSKGTRKNKRDGETDTVTKSKTAVLDTKLSIIQHGQSPQMSSLTF